MSNSYLDVFMPVLSLAVNIVIQISSVRYVFKGEVLCSVFLGCFIGAIGLFLSGLIRQPFDLFVVHISTYFLLSYCYFHFVNLGETGRRIRILRELNDNKEGLSLNEILQRYDAGELIERRILRLTKNKQIIFKNGKYYLGRKELLCMAEILLFFKHILFSDKSL